MFVKIHFKTKQMDPSFRHAYCIIIFQVKHKKNLSHALENNGLINAWHSCLDMLFLNQTSLI